MDEPPLCVLCHKRPREERWRPFCSERCRLIDLGTWAAENYRVAGEEQAIPDEPTPKPPGS